MSAKHNDNLRKIIQAKAHFLIHCQADSVHFEVVENNARRMEAAIAAMPTRGFRQRERQVKAYRDLDELTSRMHQRIGASVMRSYGFVSNNRHLLSPGVRRMLFGCGK